MRAECRKGVDERTVLERTQVTVYLQPLSGNLDDQVALATMMAARFKTMSARGRKQNSSSEKYIANVMVVEAEACFIHLPFLPFYNFATLFFFPRDLLPISAAP